LQGAALRIFRSSANAQAGQEYAPKLHTSVGFFVQFHVIALQPQRINAVDHRADWFLCLELPGRHAAFHAQACEEIRLKTLLPESRAAQPLLGKTVIELSAHLPETGGLIAIAFGKFRFNIH
jgi:hypothetical protein